MRQRAHHLAQELGISLKELVAVAQSELGLQIRSHAVLLHREHVRRLRAAVQKQELEASGSVG